MKMEGMCERISAALEDFNQTAADAMSHCGGRFTWEYFRPAAELIEQARRAGGRLHVTGIGKPHHISAYTASLFSSIGVPCYLLDGTEATHGSSGQVAACDVVICISYYGDVQELNRAVETLRKNGAKLIGVTGFPNSFIARACDVHLDVHVDCEGDSLGRAPRTSMLSTLLAMMGLSLVFQELNGLTLEKYLKWHPSGILGTADGVASEHR